MSETLSEVTDYMPFNDELDEIVNATPERAAAVAEIRAEMDAVDLTAEPTAGD
jgi:hypothetical protein